MIYLHNKFHMPSTNGSLVIAMKQAAKLCILIKLRIVTSYLLLCLCTLIIMYVLFCIFCFHRAS
jgi:hypothetical protein